MYLSRLLLDPRSRDVRRDLADAQELHRTLLSAFGQSPDGVDARAHFGVLHRIEIDARKGEIAVLVLSRATPDWTRLPVGVLVGVPATKTVDDAYTAIRSGSVLRFCLVANPTKAAFVRGERGTRRSVTSDDERLAWLVRRLHDGGGRVLSAALRPVPSVVLRHGGKTVSLPAVRFDGVAEIIDPDALRLALADGIGSGKAYGMGLLTIAPA